MSLNTSTFEAHRAKFLIVKKQHKIKRASSSQKRITMVWRVVENRFFKDYTLIAQVTMIRKNEPKYVMDNDSK